MINFYVKNKLALIILVFILAVSAGVYFLAAPLARQIQSVSDQIQSKLIDKDLEEKRVGSLPQLESDWSEVEGQRDALNVILGTDSEIGFIEGVEYIAQKTNNVITLNIGNNADPKEIAKIKRANGNKESEKGILDEVSYTSYFPIQIELKGDYNGLVNFVHMLENSQFYVNVISIDAQKGEVEDQKKETVPSDQNANGEKTSKHEIINTRINAIVYTKNQ